MIDSSETFKVGQFVRIQVICSFLKNLNADFSYSNLTVCLLKTSRGPAITSGSPGLFFEGFSVRLGICFSVTTLDVRTILTAKFWSKRDSR